MFLMSVDNCKDIYIQLIESQITCSFTVTWTVIFLPDVQKDFSSNINSDAFGCLELDSECRACEVEINPCRENQDSVELSS